MAIDRQLARWVDAGLIESDQADAISSFERSQSRPTFLYAIAGLGGLAISIGLISIVAANWAEIPGRVKIAIDLLVVAAVGQAVVRWDARNRTHAREVGILVLYGLVLASIALIGQVYQLGGKIHTALMTWSVLTAWMMTRGHSGVNAFLWVLGLQVTYLATIANFGQDETFGVLMAASFYWTSLGLLWLAETDWLRERRPRFVRVFRGVAWAELVWMGGSLGPLAFYEETSHEVELSGVWIGLIVATGLTAAIVRNWSSTPADRARRNLLITCLVFTHVPLLVSPVGLGVLSALCFIGLWFLVAVAAHRSGAAGVLNLATAMIGIRLLVVYFEVFGSLLGTGVGLVSGGLLTLGGLWFWMRKRREFAEEFAPTASDRTNGDAAAGDDDTTDRLENPPTGGAP